MHLLNSISVGIPSYSTLYPTQTIADESATQKPAPIVFNDTKGMFAYNICFLARWGKISFMNITDVTNRALTNVF